ncbi:hypothetical protein P3S68_023764 [Capsicum galapagoense]
MALISDPYFTMKHRKLSKNNQNSPKILFLKDMFTLHLSSLTQASLSLDQFTENVQKLDWLYGSKPGNCKIYCCYDGLVLYMILKIGYQSCSEILALESGSWRIIGKPTGIYSSWLSNMDSLAFVHGAFHWLGLSRNESVTSYDISNGGHELHQTWPFDECIRNGFTTSFRGVADLVGAYNFTYAFKLLDLLGAYIRMSNLAIFIVVTS